ncbi:hypothetical protein ACFVVL_27765 [Kitasatospora sp. NPDC058115]|uniref:hypothetical protein n=1 Tax=Kitasatospora sp. NPDC058115 TaxID=3346347 RepID=UPI0036D91FBF
MLHHAIPALPASRVIVVMILTVLTFATAAMVRLITVRLRGKSAPTPRGRQDRHAKPAHVMLRPAVFACIQV